MQKQLVFIRRALILTISLSTILHFISKKLVDTFDIHLMVSFNTKYISAKILRLKISAVICAAIFLAIIFISSASAAVITWEGDVDTNWSNPNNWSTGAIPDASSNVVFNSTGNTASTIDALFTNTIASMTIESGYTQTITQSQNFTVEGSYVQSDGVFNCSAPQTYTFSVGGSFSIPTAEGSFKRFDGDGSSGTPYLINDIYGLQAMKCNKSGKYFKIADTVSSIDASSTSHWNLNGSTYEGFSPAGYSSTDPFVGALDGNSKDISGLWINRTAQDNVGLFGYFSGAASVISNVYLADANVKGKDYVGGLAGRTNITGGISNCHITGTVEGKSGSLGYVGGLVGSNTSSTITNSYATGEVTGGENFTGGLVGRNNASTITNSYATGAVSGTGGTSWLVGGLTGDNYGSAIITNCYATGAVNGDLIIGGLVGVNRNGSTVKNSYAIGNVTGSGGVGGLVGQNSSTITNSYATGEVAGVSASYSNVGGLVGENSSIITNSYATGKVTGANMYTGGLAGYNSGSSAIITNSYATGTVTGSNYTGGLVGYNLTSAAITNSYATGVVSGITNTGGFIGLYATGTLTSNYWYKDAGHNSGLNNCGSGSPSGGITYETDALMKQRNTFVGWNFNSPWLIDENKQYPYLTFEAYNWNGTSGGSWTTGSNWKKNLIVQSGVVLNNDPDASVYIATTDAISIPAGTTLGRLQLGSGVNNSVTLGGDVTITDSGIREGSFTMINGTLDLQAYNPNVTIEGNVNLIGGTVAAGAGEVHIINNVWYYDSTGTRNLGRVFAGASPDTLTLSSDATFSSLTINSGDTVVTNGYNITCEGDLTIIGTLDATTAGGRNSTISLKGNWTNGGNFIADTSTAIFTSAETASSITGSTTFNNFSCTVPGKALTFEAGSTQEVTGTLAVSGEATNKIFLRSSLSSQPWYINPDNYSHLTPTVNFVDVQDSTNMSTEVINPLNSHDVGNNIMWFNSYTITSTCEPYDISVGTIEPFGIVSCSSGSSETYTISAEAGYYIANVKLNGVPTTTEALISPYIYTITNPQQDNTIEATFVQLGTKIWDGGGSTNNWSEAANWTENTIPEAGDTVVFNSTSTKNSTVDASFAGTVQNITIEASYTGTIEQVSGLTVTLTFSQEGGYFNSDYSTTFSVEGSFSIPTLEGSFKRFSGAGTSALDPYMIKDIYGLQAMKSNKAGYFFKLNNDIDASLTENWNLNGSTYEGFSPAGYSSADPFVGTLDGNSKNISGLRINRAVQDNVGLFGYFSGAESVISNVYLTTANVKGKSYVGGLAGRTNTTGGISNCHITGTVEGSSSYVGGLVGWNVSSTITNCYATEMVTGTDYTGGLVGGNRSSYITNSYATGEVTGTNWTGGLVGFNYLSSTITNSYATGIVTGTNNYTGGLVGRNEDSSPITSCYATGTVNGSAATGGLVGFNTASSTITNSYATGQVTSLNTYVGGLVGLNGASNITNSYATGNASGDPASTGGLVGYDNGGTIASSYYSGTPYNSYGTSKEASQLKQRSTFSGWDFDSVWLIDENKQYPYLIFEAYNYQSGAWDSASSWLKNLITPEAYPQGQDDSVYINTTSSLTVPSGTFGRLQLGPGFTGTLQIVGDITIESAGTREGSFTMTNGILDLATSNPNLTIKGFVNMTGGSVSTGTGQVNIKGDVWYYDSLGTRNLGRVFAGASPDTLTLSSDATFSSLTINALDTFVTGGYNITCEGNLTINGTLDATNGAGGDSIIAVKGSWTNSGNFIADTSTAIFASAETASLITGSTTFNNFSCTVPGKALTFEAGSTQEVTGTLTISGEAVNRVILRSSSAGTPWNINPESNRSVYAVDVQDSTNISAEVINPLSSHDAGNNINWFNSYTIISTCEPYDVNVGTIEPFGIISCSSGSSEIYTISAEAGYYIANVKLNGVPTTTEALISPYICTVIPLQQDNTIEATFMSTLEGKIWDGEGSTNNWSEGANWTGNATPESTDTAVFNSTSTKNSTVDASFAVQNITIEAAYTGTIEQTSGLTVTSTFSQEGGYFNSDYTKVFSVEGSFSIPTAEGSFKRFSGAGILGDPYLIKDVYGLQAMKCGLGKYYELANDITADATSNWNLNGVTYEGFSPIGDNVNTFSGTLEGNNKTISNLVIDRSSTDYVGLFGFIYYANTLNVGLLNANIHGGSDVGSLAGSNQYSTIRNCYATGALTGEGNYVGGLVGLQTAAIITGSYSTATVKGAANVGGLIGNETNSTVDNCYAAGEVNATWGGWTYTGGLIGAAGDSTITSCYATGNVNCPGVITGGLIGTGGNTVIKNSYATGSISGASYSGGLVGASIFTSIESSYAIGSVNGNGNGNVGGLVGSNGYFYVDSGGTISNCYATGPVSGSDNVGGLAGGNILTGKITNCYSAGSVSGSSNTGGLVGLHTGNTVEASYYDSTTTGQSDTGKGISLETSAMKQKASFSPAGAGWDFDSVWLIDENKQYPYLTMEAFNYQGGPWTSASSWLKNLVTPEAYPTCESDSVYINTTGSLAVPVGTTYGRLHLVAGTLTLSGNLSLSSSGNREGSLNIYGGTLDCASYTINLYGNFIRSGGTFTQGTGTVEFLGSNPSSITGSTTFNNFSCTAAGKAFTFEAGSTQEVTGTLTISGEAGNRIILRSSSAGTPWNINPESNISVYAVDVQDSTNMSTEVINPLSSHDAGNNINWFNFYTIISTCEPYDVNVGTIEPFGIISCSSGSSEIYTISAEAGYYIANVKLNGVPTTTEALISPYICTVIPLQQDNTIEATFMSTLEGKIWDGEGSTNNWSEGANWTGNATPESTDTAVFNSTSTKNSTVDAAFSGTVQNITIEASYTGTIEQTSDLTVESTFSQLGVHFNSDYTKAFSVGGSFSIPIAEGSFKRFSGSGISGDPYMIKDVYGLQAMICGLGKYYELANDISADATSYWNLNGATYEGFVPIGDNSNNFTGYLNGDNKTITGIYINRPLTNSVGFFGYTSGGTISNLSLTGVNITGQDCTGGFVGYNGSTIANCYSTGSVSGQNWGVGGFAGQNWSTVTDCYSTGSVSGSGTYVGGFAGENWFPITTCYSMGSVSGGYNVGGFAGRTWSTITNCYSTGSVSVSGDNVGGFAGYNGSTITNCYSTGSVSGHNWGAGGFAGQNWSTIANCYSTGSVSGSDSYVGGFTGQNNSAITNCYYDRTTSGQSDNDGRGIPKTTTEMKQRSTFTPPAGGWDFTGTWLIDENKQYPYLTFEAFNYQGGAWTSASSWLKNLITPEAWPTCESDSVYINTTIPLDVPAGTTYGRLHLVAGTLTLSGNLSLSSSGNREGSLNIYGGTLDCASYAINLYGNFIRSGGTFTQGTGTVEFTGSNPSSIEGSTIFNNFRSVTAGKAITFEATKIQTVEGTFTISGEAGNRIILRSSSAGTPWNINPESNRSVYAVDVQDSTNMSTEVINPLSSHDAGNNINWFNFYTIISTCEPYDVNVGTIEPFGIISCSSGSSETYTISAGAGYYIANVKLNGISTTTEALISPYIYTVTPLQQDNTIEAMFVQVGTKIWDGEGSTNNWSEGTNWTGNATPESTDTAVFNSTSTKNSTVDASFTGTVKNITIEASYTGTISQEANLTITGDFTQEAGSGKFICYDPVTCSFSVGGSFTIPTTEGAFKRFTGDGSSSSDPYMIYDIYGLQALKCNKSGKYFKVADTVSSIDASATAHWNLNGSTYEGFSPAGYSSTDPFVGTVDGNNKNISGLRINRAAQDNVGLFGYINNAARAISNVYLTDANIKGKTYVGGLAGYINTAGGISNCHITGTVEGSNYVGGLIGINQSSTITNSYATGIASGGDTVGGLVGANSAQISNCYATGNVNGASGSYYVGGLVGLNQYQISNSYATGIASGGDIVGGLVGLNYAPISNCYATGDATSSSRVGGLVGYNDASGPISNCYATGIPSGLWPAGLVSHNYGPVTNSYYLGPDSGNGAGTKETIAQMKQRATFSGWDFEGPSCDWSIDEGIDYPRLMWQLYNWTGSFDATWSDARNWTMNFATPDAAPSGAGDKVFINKSNIPGSIPSLLGGLQIGPGCGNITLGSALTLDNSSTHDGSLIISTGGAASLNAGGNDLKVSGSFINRGTFSSSGLVEFINSSPAPSEIAGNSTFQDLKCVVAGKIFSFEAGSTQEVTGTLTISGEAGNEIKLRSSSSPLQWYIDPKDGKDVNFVDVKDSYNTSSEVIGALNSINSLNNVMWFAYTITTTFDSNGTIDPVGPVTTNEGSNTTFTISAEAHYHIADVLVDGSSVGTPDSYTFSSVEANHSIEAQFAINTYTITTTFDSNGTINPVGPVTTNEGSDTTFTITPNASYHISDVLVDGSSVGTPDSYTFTNVTSNHSIEAQFAINTWTITSEAGVNGTIEPLGIVTTNEGSDTTFTITPNASYHISDVLVDGSSIGTPGSYTFISVAANHSIEAQFAINTYLITSEAGLNGTIEPLGIVTTNEGSDTTFTITAEAYYRISDLKIDGVSTTEGIGSQSYYYTFPAVNANHSIEAQFAINNIFTIEATKGSGGTIEPWGIITTNEGLNTTFTITAEAHYHIADVLVDGSSVGTPDSYTFSTVEANHSIEAQFAINNTFTIEAIAGVNGTIEPLGIVTTNEGSDTTFTITAEAYYRISDIKIDGVSTTEGIGDQSHYYTFNAVEANHSIEAQFAINNTFTIEAIAGVNGTIEPLGIVTTNEGSNTTFTISAEAHYHIANVLVDGTSVGTPGSYTFSTVEANHSIEAQFAINTWTITAEAGLNGTIEPLGIVTTNEGSNTTFTITPNASYHISDVLVDGSSVGTPDSYTFSSVEANHNIEAQFAINTYLITSEVTVGTGHGTIDAYGTTTTNEGSNTTFTITAEAHYHIADVLVDGSSVGTPVSYTFSTVEANHTIEAQFLPNNTFTIEATKGSGGTIEPWGIITTNEGSDTTYSISAEAHYHIADVLVDGVSVGTPDSYAFTNIAANHSIEAQFLPNNTFTIEATKGSGGTIEPWGIITTNEGSNTTYTITAEAYYHIADVLVDGTTVGTSGSYTFTNIAANHTIEAQFAINNIFTIEATKGTGGTIEPWGIITTNEGSNTTFKVIPDAGYQTQDLIVDGSSKGALTSYTFTTVEANHTIEAKFISGYVNAPVNCLITPILSSSVSVSWEYSGSVITAFHIEKSIDGTSYSEVGTTPNGTTTYTGAGTTGLAVNTRYWYRVNAEVSGVFSGYSTATPKYTLSEQPVAKSFTDISSSVIAANWDANGNPIGTRYNIKNVTTGTSGTTTETSYKFSGLTSGTTYVISVESMNEDDINSIWADLGAVSTLASLKIPDMFESGTRLFSGDIIRAKSRFNVTLPSSTIDPATYRMYIDGTEVSDGTMGRYDSFTEGGGVATFEYEVKIPLIEGTHVARVTVQDYPGNIYDDERTGLRVMTSSGVVGYTVVSPNPYNPVAGDMKITYNLATDASVTIYMFDVNGRLVWKNNYSIGTNGGKAGYNEVLWNGINAFGSITKNDLYLIRIVESGTGRLLGKAKMMLLRGVSTKENKEAPKIVLLALLFVGIALYGGSMKVYKTIRKMRNK